jgi:hypothetical protein
MHPIQLKIAWRAAQLLKSATQRAQSGGEGGNGEDLADDGEEGGLMCYSTCSLNPMENEAVVEELLRRGGGSLELVDPRPMLEGMRLRKGLNQWKVALPSTLVHAEEANAQARTGAQPQQQQKEQQQQQKEGEEDAVGSGACSRGSPSSGGLIWYSSYQEVPRSVRQYISRSAFRSPPAPATALASGEGAAAMDYASELTGIYERNNPSKLDDPTVVTTTLQRFAGKEAELIQALKVKYKEEETWSSGQDLSLCGRLLPHDHDTGGFFVALLRKVKPIVLPVPTPTPTPTSRVQPAVEKQGEKHGAQYESKRKEEAQAQTKEQAQTRKKQRQLEKQEEQQRRKQQRQQQWQQRQQEEQQEDGEWAKQNREKKQSKMLKKRKFQKQQEATAAAAAAGGGGGEKQGKGSKDGKHLNKKGKGGGKLAECKEGDGQFVIEKRSPYVPVPAELWQGVENFYFPNATAAVAGSAGGGVASSAGVGAVGVSSGLRAYPPAHSCTGLSLSCTGLSLVVRLSTKEKAKSTAGARCGSGNSTPNGGVSAGVIAAEPTGRKDDAVPMPRRLFLVSPDLASVLASCAEAMRLASCAEACVPEETDGANKVTAKTAKKKNKKAAASGYKAEEGGLWMIHAGVGAFVHGGSTSQQQVQEQEGGARTASRLGDSDGDAMEEDVAKDREEHQEEQEEQEDQEMRLVQQQEKEPGVTSGAVVGMGCPLHLPCAYRLCQDALTFLLPALVQARSPRLLSLAPTVFEALLRQRTISMRAQGQSKLAVRVQDGQQMQPEHAEQDLLQLSSQQDLLLLSSLVQNLTEMSVGALAVVTDVAQQASMGRHMSRDDVQRRHVSQQHQLQPQDDELSGKVAQQRPCMVAWRGRSHLDTFVKRAKRDALLSLCRSVEGQ